MSRKGIPNKVRKPRSRQVSVRLSPDELEVLASMNQPTIAAALHQAIRLAVWRPSFGTTAPHQK